MSINTPSISTNNQPFATNLDCYQTYFEIDHPRDGFGKTLVKLALWILCFWFLIPWKALRVGTTEQNPTLPTAGPTTTPTIPTSTVAASTSAITRSAATTATSFDPTQTIRTINLHTDNTQAFLLRNVLSQNNNIRYRILFAGNTLGEICLAIRNNHVEIISYNNTHRATFPHIISAIEEAKEILIRLAVEESNSRGFGGSVTTTAGDPQIAEILRRQSTPPASPTTAATTTQASAVITPAPTNSAPPATTSSTQQTPIAPTAPSTTQTPTVATSAPTSTAPLDIPTLRTIRFRNDYTHATLAKYVLTQNGNIRYRILVAGACCGEICLAFRSNHVEIISYGRHTNHPSHTTQDIEEAKEFLVRLAVEESNSRGFRGRVTTTAGDPQIAEILRRQSTPPTQQTVPTPPAPPTTAASTTVQASAVVTLR